jgi:hypothetical protein
MTFEGDHAINSLKFGRLINKHRDSRIGDVYVTVISDEDDRVGEYRMMGVPPPAEPAKEPDGAF